MRAALAVLALVLAIPATASAGTVTRSGSVIGYQAAPGERNAVGIEASEAQILIITDTGAPVAIAPGSGCVELDPGTPGAGAQCSAPAGTALVVDLGDGDDRYVADDGVSLPETVGGGEGADRIEAGAGPGALGGGPGDDTVDGSNGNDLIRGDAGTDLVRGGSGADDLGGGSGEDRIDARTGGGRDRVTCETGDIVLRSATDTVEGCGGRPSASLRIPRQRIRSFFDRNGLDFRVRCAQPCAIGFEIVARDRSTRRRIHQRDRRLDKERPRTDADGFPVYLDAGTNVLHARPIGRTTRRDIRSARILRLRLIVTVIDRNGLERELARNFTLRR